MPYKSLAQERYFNANRSKIGAKVVDEFNAASRGLKLPKKLKGEAHNYDSRRPKRKVVSRYK